MRLKRKAVPKTEEGQETTVKGHKRKIGQKAAKIAHLPLKERHHELSKEQRICDQCGTQMTDIGTTKIREEVLSTKPCWIGSFIYNIRIVAKNAKRQIFLP